MDEPREYRKRPGLWCHLVADSLEELHAMAAQIGIDATRFQWQGRHPHYDLSEQRRGLALRAGAIPVSRRELVHILRRRSGSH